MIVLTDVCKIFGKKTVLEALSLTINPGEFVCIVGASGTGKSTLLRLLTGEERVTDGRIEVDGVDLKSLPPPVLQLYRRRIGVVFQDARLLPRRTVAENCAFPLESAGWDDAAIRERATEVLSLLHLSSLADAEPVDLSAGERALTAVARSIAHLPMILLADEPTGNLDPQQTKEVLRLFQQFHQAGATVVLATHDLPLAQSLSARMVELRDGKTSEVTPAGVSPAAAKHDILSRAPSASEEAGRRKIKVTMIHS